MTFALPHQKRTFVIVILAVTALLFLLSTQAIATMFGLFKKYDVHLSPEVHGIITNQNEPVVGLKVFRGLTYGDNKELIDETSTDTEGRFSFAEKNIRSRKPGSMFDESRVFQTIYLNYQDTEYLLWYTVTEGKIHKNIYEKLQLLNCDLKTQEEKHYFKNYEHPSFTHNVLSICRWKNK